MKILKPALGTLILGFSLTAFSAYAQTATDNQAKPGTTQQTDRNHQNANAPMSDEARKSRYEAEKKRCETMQGDQKDICEKKAETDRDTAKADSERAKKNAEADRDANKDKKEAQYDLEKEKCEAMSGDAQDRCITELKTRFDK